MTSEIETVGNVPVSALLCTLDVPIGPGASAPARVDLTVVRSLAHAFELKRLTHPSYPVLFRHPARLQSAIRHCEAQEQALMDTKSAIFIA
jgi:hypothetical protein